MFDLMLNNKGAISIFLVIVLLPMLVFSSLFVDMSRISLAESVAESSGELTLNTALTNYDAVLKDMYGLFATSQNTDELFANLENYYRQCIEAAGVAEPDAEDYVAQIMQYVKSETGRDDMLNMNLTSFEITKPTGGNLANPAILKSQIVEFMKYRGPINLGMGIFDALGSLKNVKKQSQLVDNKNKFYTQQASMMEKLESVWNDLEDYQYRDAYTMYKGDKCTFPDGDYLKISAELMNSCIPLLQDSAAYIVRYLYFADTNYVKHEGYRIAKESSSNDAYTEIWKINPDGIEHKVNATPDKKTGSVDTVIADLKVVYRLAQKLESHKTDDSVFAELMNSNNNVSATEKIRLVSKASALINSEYQKDVKDFVRALVELKNAWNNCDSAKMAEYTVYIEKGANGAYDTIRATNDKNATGESRGPLGSFVNTQLKAHLSETGGHIKTYNGLMSNVYNYYNDTKPIVDRARVYVTESANMALSCAWTLDYFLSGKIKKLESAHSKLTLIQGELSDEKSDYNLALEAWRTSANDLTGEAIGDNDLSEIAKLEKVLTIDKVKALCTRIESAKSSLQSVKDQVGKFEVLGKAWKDLASGGSVSYSTMQNLLTTGQKNSIANVEKSTDTRNYRTETITTMNNKSASAKYDTAYDSVVNTLKATIKTVQIKTSWEVSEDSVSPNLIKSQVALYTWLYNNFFNKASVEAKFNLGTEFDGYKPTEEKETTATDTISSNKNNADKSQTGMEGKADAYNDSAKNPTPSDITPPNRTYDTNFLPSGEQKEFELHVQEGNSDTSKDSDAMLSSSNSSLSSLDRVMELVGNMATTLRDDLYICNYIMNMFSYSTYEAEIAVANGNDGSAFSSWYEWNADESKYKLKSDFGTKYSNSSEMLKDARTLTKVSINPNANYLYGKEVEYIIYGDGGVAKTYGTIYMIRFALNTVYAFTDAEIGNITTAAATAIFGTPPLTPLIPIAKIAMTIGLALAESAYDLYELKCGEKIPLVKNSKTWVMKPSSAAKAVVGEIAEELVDEAIDRGVKLLNEALEMTDEELEKIINGTGDEFKELANAALDSTMNELKNYGNQAVQEIVNICNDINTAAMEKADYVQGQTQAKIDAAIEKLDVWLASQGSSETDVVYLAKKTAVDYLKKNNGKVIGQLFDKIAQVGNKTQGEIESLGLDLEEILDDIQKEIDSNIENLSQQGENALHNMRENAMEDLKKAAADGAESLRSKLKEQIGATFGTSGAKTAGTNSIVSSLLSWSYSDYLQLFLVIGTIASPESILLRTADIIELNMQQIDGNLGYVEVTTEKEVSRLWGLIKYTKTETKKEANADAFKLKNSYTYLSIKATIEVKPMLLTLPLMADTVESQLTGTNWYEITYEGTMGY